jgi:acyl dehydratase
MGVGDLDTEPGARLGTFTRSPDLAHWNRFAAVNDEFVPIHMDDQAGREAGYPSAIGMGNLQWSYLHGLLRQWGGDEVRIERVACQFRAPNLRGQTVTATGQVVARRHQDGRLVLDLEVWTEDDQGQRLAPGTATVSFPDPGA